MGWDRTLWTVAEPQPVCPEGLLKTPSQCVLVGWSSSASVLLVSQWSAFNSMIQECPYVRPAGRSLKGDFPKASWSLLQPKWWKNQNDSIHDNISIKTPFLLLSAHCWFCCKDGGPLISHPLLLTPQSSEQESYGKEGEQDVRWDCLYKNDLIVWITGCRNLKCQVLEGWDSWTRSVAITQNSKQSFLRDRSGSGSELLISS